MALSMLYWAVAYVAVLPRMVLFLTIDILIQFDATRNFVLKKLKDRNAPVQYIEKGRRLCTVSWLTYSDKPSPHKLFLLIYYNQRIFNA